MPTILWWGRSDTTYSRNRIIQSLLSDLGWSIQVFHPIISQLGFIEAYWRRLNSPDIIWVPSFRHQDIFSASRWASRWGVPLIIDPLISAFEKEAYEREKFDPGSASGRKRRLWEANLFSLADIVVADTPAHAEFFSAELQVKPDKVMVIYVGAEAGMFKYEELPPLEKPYHILFYGSFIPLQGAEVIVQAAKQTLDLPVVWTLLGEGDLKADCINMANGSRNIRFEPWLPYEDLPERISEAHVLLGIFGTTMKADLVIPNKLFQSMALGRPVITRRSRAFADTLGQSNIIGWVPEGDPSALAFVVKKWFVDPSHLIRRGEKTRELYDAFFSRNKLKNMLAKILETAMNRKRSVKD